MNNNPHASVVSAAVTQTGDTPATVRAPLVRAATRAGVEIADKMSPSGFYFGLMTPKRKSRRGRPRKAAGAQ
jgi:hypothetical protein